jgi:PAN domain
MKLDVEEARTMTGRNYRTGSPHRISAICAAALGALMAGSISTAFAACGDRPGTPTNVKTSAGVGSITLSWLDTTRRGEGSCHDIEILRTAPGDDRSITGSVCLRGATDGQYTVNNVVFGEQYCFRIRARDRAGTQGCVSAQWSNKVCDSALPTSGPGVGRTSELMHGIDLPGFDIPESAGGRIVTLVPVGQTPNVDALARDCQNACSRHGRCVAWTMVKPGVQGPSTVCWLKHQVPAPVQSACCESGHQVMANTDKPGMDIDRVAPSLSSEDCEKTCAANQRCATWTFVKPGVQQPSGVCYLKGSLPKSVANNCCTSGRIR